MENQAELWERHPDIEKLEVSTFGRVRSVKGHYYKNWRSRDGYLYVSFRIDGKRVSKRVNRLVAQTFINNPDNLSVVNHKNCVRDDNRVNNLEWCTPKYNSQYRKKYGVSQTEAVGHPLFAVNLDTLEVSHFRSQHEAGRLLGFGQGNIGAIVRGKRKQTHGYWFVNDDENAADAIKRKLNCL